MIDTVEPRLAKLRKESELPKSRKSSMLTALPNRVVLKMLTVDPNPAKLRSESPEPIVT
jgi:hypothetical protein